MGFFKRLFGSASRQEWAPTEVPPVEREEFYRFISREGAWLLTKGLSEQGEATFIDYRDDEGRLVWPVFSTPDTATMWVREVPIRQITTYPCVQLTPAGFVDNIPAGARVVFDPRTPYERSMTEDDLLFLRSLVRPA